MAISDTQKVDYLWKKIGYGVAKSDTDTNKKAYEEAIASPLLLRGDKLWAQSGNIPGSIPTTSSSVVRIYKDGTGSWASTIKATVDSTATLNRTWKTGVTDWIPVEFGPTFQVQVYIDADASTTPQSTGTKIFAAGSGNNDEWYFDYQAGVLNFIGANLPSALTAGKSIFIAGARYIGTFGLSGSVSTAAADLGNIHIENNTISSINANGNIILAPNGSGNVSITSNLSIANGNIIVANANLGNLATANFFSGDGGYLSNIPAGNITGSANLGNVSANSVSANSVSANSVSSNVVITSAIVSGNLTITPVNSPNTVIDSFTPSTYRTAKYVIKASSDIGYESMEVLLIHDNSNSYITIYGSISTATDSNSIVTLSSNVASGNIKLYATGTSSNTVVNFVGTYITD